MGRRKRAYAVRPGLGFQQTGANSIFLHLDNGPFMTNPQINDLMSKKCPRDMKTFLAGLNDESASVHVEKMSYLIVVMADHIATLKAETKHKDNEASAKEFGVRIVQFMMMKEQVAHAKKQVSDAWKRLVAPPKVGKTDNRDESDAVMTGLNGGTGGVGVGGGGGGGVGGGGGGGVGGGEGGGGGGGGEGGGGGGGDGGCGAYKRKYDESTEEMTYVGGLNFDCKYYKQAGEYHLKIGEKFQKLHTARLFTQTAFSTLTCSQKVVLTARGIVSETESSLKSAKEVLENALAEEISANQEHDFKKSQQDALQSP